MGLEDYEKDYGEMNKDLGVGAGAPPRMAGRELLLQLADRCEREEPSLELSVRIFLALNDPDILVIDDSTARFPRPHRHVKARSLWNDDWKHWHEESQVEGVARELICPHYTSSLDAAVTLVPEEWNWVVERFTFDSVMPYKESGAKASVWRDSRNPQERIWNIETLTPALALCAAALRARAAESPADERDRRGSERSSRVARHNPPQENDHG